MSAGKQYSYINTGYINELTDGDKEFIEQIISACLTELPDNLQKLTTAVNTNNTEHIRFYSHKLKGSFLFIGSEHLGKSFATMEAYSKDAENYYQIPSLFWTALGEARKAMEELKDLLKDVS